jgi:hypothetical protein
MLRTKVLEIFKKLSSDELKQFRDFVRSPYHNKNKNVITLFEVIRKFAPYYESENLSKEMVFRKIFPRKGYNDMVLRILLSDLMRITEDFLVQKRIEKTKLDYNKYLLAELMDRKIERMFVKKYNEFNNGSSDYRLDDCYFSYRYDIEELNKGFNINRNMQHLNSSNLVDMGKYLVIYFLMKISSIVHDMNVNKVNFNTLFEEGSYEAFLKIINPESIHSLIKKKDFKDNEILELYFLAFILNDNSDSDSNYFRLKEIFYRNISRIDRGATYNMFLALLNYNGKKHWDDKSNNYRRESFELHKDMLSRGIFSWSKDEYMTVINFRSILTMCSLLREIDWMEYFINNYIEKLAPEQRQNMLYFSLSKLNFAKRNYSAALNNLCKVDLNLFTFKFDLKTLMLQIYYELGYYEEALAMMDSFKHFLANNKNVSPSFKEWNLNFINLFHDLLNSKSGRKAPDLDLLNKKIFESANAASQNWLKDKIVELQNVTIFHGEPAQA